MIDKEKKNKIADILLDFYDEYHSNEINRPMIPSIYAGKILDSLQEKPVSKELEDAAFDYAEACKYEGGEKLLCVEHFKAGAKWQFNQLEKNRLAACDRASKEEIEREQDFCDKIIIGEHRQPTFSDAIEYGIKWQKEQDIKHGYVTFLQGEKHFANSILEMINNGWHIVAIKTACNDKIKED